MSYLTRRDLLAVECPRCGAEVGQKCRDTRFACVPHRVSLPVRKIETFHGDRHTEARSKGTTQS
jgi:hypothetical protein